LLRKRKLLEILKDRLLREPNLSLNQNLSQNQSYNLLRKFTTKLLREMKLTSYSPLS
jgi:hypothetical protein